MSLKICTNCGEHHYDTETICPHCDCTHKSDAQRSTHRSSMAILLGLTLVGCGDKENDTSPHLDTSTQPLYGVAMIDNDIDGWGEFDGDCDDNDSNTYPGAAENDSIDVCMKDSDGDGYGDNAPTNANVDEGTDCDDTDANRHPNATETAGDRIDSNCNGNDDD